MSDATVGERESAIGKQLADQMIGFAWEAAARTKTGGLPLDPHAIARAAAERLSEYGMRPEGGARTGRNGLAGSSSSGVTGRSSSSWAEPMPRLTDTELCGVRLSRTGGPGHLFTAIGTAAVILTMGTACGSSPQRASDRPVTHAYVPGIGSIDGYVKPGTPVRPPARVPHTKDITGSELDRELANEERLFNQVHPSSDSGPRNVVAQVRRDLTADLFLDQAVGGCDRVPRAGFAVVAYLWTHPSRRAELDNLHAGQPARDVHQFCRATRLRIAVWQGVRVNGSSATAMLTGYRESRAGTGWEAFGPRGRTVFRARLLLVDGRWRLAVVDEEYPDDTET